MTDSLTVFGTDFTGVTGIKATGTGNGTLTYIRPQGTKSISANGTGIDVASYASVDVSVDSDDFIVTLSYNDQTEMWEPDCTYAEAYAAVQAGKNVVAEAGDYNGASIVYDDEEIGGFYYIVYAQFDEPNGTQYYNWGVRFPVYVWTTDGIELDEDAIAYDTSIDTATPSDVAQGKYFHGASGIQVGTASGGASVKTATGTFTGNGTRTIDVSCSWEPDLVYFTSDPGTTASSGTVAAIIVRGMMTATRYRNNSTTNSHYAIPGIANMNSSGSSYSWRATYANSKVTLYCYSSNARGLLTNGRTYSYTFMKWT